MTTTTKQVEQVSLWVRYNRNDGIDTALCDIAGALRNSRTGITLHSLTVRGEAQCNLVLNVMAFGKEDARAMCTNWVMAQCGMDVMEAV